LTTLRVLTTLARPLLCGAGRRILRPLFVRCGIRNAGGMEAAASESRIASDVVYVSTRITTRRFCLRPSRVLFGASGFSSP